MNGPSARNATESASPARNSLCFVEDTDFGCLQGFAKS